MSNMYRKTMTIQAEQFDGSEAMMNKYHITEICWSTGIREFAISTLEGEIELYINDWIATGAYGEHWPIRDKIFRKIYKEVSEDEA